MIQLKKLKRFVIIVLALFIVVIWGYQKYTIRQIVTGELITFNPFQIDKNDYQQLSIELAKTIQINKKQEICSDLLRYENSHNESGSEKLFTDGNGLYNYKIKKTLDYATCYEVQGYTETALKALSPLMNNVVITNYSIKDKYFELATKIYGKETLLNEMEKGLDKIVVSDCDYCFDRSYILFGTKIGIISEYSEEVKPKEYYHELVKSESYYKKLILK